MSGTQDNQNTAAKPSIFKRTARYFRDTKGELKKVVWPTRKQALNNTAVVLVFMVIMGIIIGLFDTGVLALITLFFRRGA